MTPSAVAMVADSVVTVNGNKFKHINKKLNNFATHSIYKILFTFNLIC